MSGLCLSPRRACECCSILCLFADPFALLCQRFVCRSKGRADACCSVWQCVAVYCSVLQCVAVCCSVLQLFADSCALSRHCLACPVCASLQEDHVCVALCCSVFHCVAVVNRQSCPVAPAPCVEDPCLSTRREFVLQHVAVCCNCLPTLLPCRQRIICKICASSQESEKSSVCLVCRGGVFPRESESHVSACARQSEREYPSIHSGW